MMMTITPDEPKVASNDLAGCQSITRCERRSAIEKCIRESGYCELNRVRVCAINGMVVLEGKVSSYHLKQVAQESVRPLTIGMRIQNELIVLPRTLQSP